MDKKTPHSCKGVQVQQVVNNELLAQSPREKRIDELAVARTAAIERIAIAIEKSNNQNIADALYFLAESMTEMAHAIKTLALAQTQVKEQEQEITAV
jgi:uncharacterized protein (UPF0254 family)